MLAYKLGALLAERQRIGRWGANWISAPATDGGVSDSLDIGESGADFLEMFLSFSPVVIITLICFPT